MKSDGLNVKSNIYLYSLYNNNLLYNNNKNLWVPDAESDKPKEDEDDLEDAYLLFWFGINFFDGL